MCLERYSGLCPDRKSYRIENRIDTYSGKTDVSERLIGFWDRGWAIISFASLLPSCVPPVASDQRSSGPTHYTAERNWKDPLYPSRRQ